MVERGRASQRSHGVVSSQRSSQRSHGTSSSSSHESRLLCKDCCRKFVSFMCTQVGVGCVLVAYAIAGSFGFQHLEGAPHLDVENLTKPYHDSAIKKMWNYTEIHNVLNKESWCENINQTLAVLQNKIVFEVNKGYDSRKVEEIWTIPATLMFSLSIFTMIGYGHMTPKTNAGKIATIVYAIFGIPLYIVYFMNMGKAFAKTFKFLYRMFYRCINKEKLEATMKTEEEEPIIIVPSTACIWVMIVYMTGGTIMFAEWEKWTYLDSCYYSFTSLAKIGMGDFVPGQQEGLTTKQRQLRPIINFLYLLVGMGLIAMCYTLMKEEMMLKLMTTKHELKEKLYYCGLRIGLYTDDEPPPLPLNHKLRPSRSRRTVRRR